MFRRFLDNLVKPEDSEIFAEVACIRTLQDSDLALLSAPDDIYPDSDDDETLATLSKTEKIKRAAAKNREVRIATSQESIQSYEDFKAEKHFKNGLNIRHVNNTPFTQLLRSGTGVCCYFQENTGYVIIKS